MKYVATSTLPASIEDAFAYHERPGALERLVPPWESVVVESSDGSLEVGSEVVLKTSVFGVPVRWVAKHTEYDPPKIFADTQVTGPFAAWDHRHEFAEQGEGCQLTDRVEYRVPAGTLGQAMGGWKARATLESMFSYRHRVTRDDLALQVAYRLSPKQIAISGCSGLVGRQLCSLLTLLGHQTRPIVRNPTENASEIAAWHNAEQIEKFRSVDAVVHLAGKSIADARWSDEVRTEIRSSRVDKTRQLCESLARLDKKPQVLVCASATGVYGNRGDEILDETSVVGDDFLADVASDWEEACRPAVEAGIRVVNARFGIVLSPQGGALQKMMFPAKFAGGALGNGKQWWSWIALDDVLGAIYHAISTTELHGPVNYVAPDAIQNRDFASTLGKVIGRPALFPAPAFALRAAMGEMADALLLASTRAVPRKLQESGYQFRFPDLDAFLRYTLGYDRLESAE